jgi:hypothetical protein
MYVCVVQALCQTAVSIPVREALAVAVRSPDTGSQSVRSRPVSASDFVAALAALRPGSVNAEAYVSRALPVRCPVPRLSACESVTLLFRTASEREKKPRLFEAVAVATPMCSIARLVTGIPPWSTCLGT